ncbi:MAG: HAMP domain-containing histidine kinase [bacterium]|nr:HAMP domain-containing histidine kinase [bacterium]
MTSRRIPWHRSLTFRLTILTAAALLAFHFLGGPVYELALRAAGQPGPEGPIYLLSDTEFEEEQSHFLAEALAVATVRDAGGQWAFDETALRAVSALYPADLDAFVLLDTQNRVLAASEGVPWQTGSTWPFEARHHAEVEIPGDPVRYGHAISKEIEEPVRGTVIYMQFYDESTAASDPFCAVEASRLDPSLGVMLFADEEEMEASFDRESRLLDAVTIAITVAIALALGFVISRWVTRRLTRLSEEVAAPVSDRGALPGPFVASGRDEIAVLARTMNSMRERIAELVGGLESRDVSHREWVAQVSHDLRTPLTALLVCIDQIEMELDQKSDATTEVTLRGLLQVARLDAGRVQALADDLFEIARLDAGDELQLESVPPGELVRKAARGLQPLAAQRELDLRVEVAQGLPELTADGRRLMRAIENLMRNAIQHADGQVVVAAGAENGCVVFRVDDDGPGLGDIAGAVRWELLRDQKSRRDSAGLGLVVTRRVAEAHDGSVGAANRPTGGASVWFSIPLGSAPD